MPEYKAPFVTAKMPDGTEVRIKRFSALAKPGLQDFKEMYQELMRLFVPANGNIGDIICDEKGLQLILDMAAILPTMDGATPGIDVTALLEAGDLEQVCWLFLTQSMQQDGKNRGKYKTDSKGELLAWEPGAIAELNQLNFIGYLSKAFQEFREQQQGLTKDLMDLELAKANGSSGSAPAVAIQK